MLDRKTVQAHGKPVIRYLVKWKSYGLAHNVWYNLKVRKDSKDLVQEYNIKNPTKNLKLLLQ